MFVGHIKVLGGPYVARGPDVAQVCSRPSLPLVAKIAHVQSHLLQGK